MILRELENSLKTFYGGPLPSIDVQKLQGDASSRSYFRVRLDPPGDGPSSLIVMQLPADAFGSDEGGAELELTRLPFLEVGELLRSSGIAVPKVYLERLEHGQILLEDLGDLTLEQRLLESPRSGWPESYARAVDLLVEIHERCQRLPPESIVARRRFDRALLDWELDHFREWGLEAPFGPLSERHAQVLSASCDELVRRIEEMPVGFVHRDYQSRNLMVGKRNALTVIDFQDAMIGPRAYDLVALLCDSYVPLGHDLQEAMIRRYTDARGIDHDRFRLEFWWVAVHRKLKDAGRFIFIDRRRGNPGFLKWVPQSLVYVGHALSRISELRALEDVLCEKIPGFPDAVAIPTSSVE